MTPTEFTGAAPASMDSELDALLSQGGSESTDNAAAEPQAAPEPPKTEPEPAVEAKPEPEPVAAKTEPESDDDLVLDDEITPEVREYRGRKEMHFAEEKGKRLLESHQFVQGLREAIPDLTVEAAKEHYSAYADMQRLQSAFESNDPVTFMQFWAQRAGNNPQAFKALTIEAMNALLEVDRDMFEQEVAAPVVTSKLDFMQNHAIQELQRAQASGDEAAIDQAGLNLYAAQRAAWALTGKYKQASGSPQGQDPYAEQRKRFEQDKQEFERARAEESAKRRQTVESDFKARLDAGSDKLIDSKVSKVAKYFASNPQFAPVTKKYLATVVQDRIAENKPWMDTYNIDRERALRAGDARSLEAVEKRYLSRVESIVNAEITKMVPAETKAAVEKNRQRHVAAAASQQREVTGNGKPAPQSIIVPPGKAGSRMAWEQELDSLIRT